VALLSGLWIRPGPEEAAVGLLDGLIRDLHGGQSGTLEPGRTHRAEVLSRIEATFETILTTGDRSRADRAAHGRIQRRLGDVHRHVGELVEAEKRYREAARIFETLAREAPETPEHGLELARTLGNGGQALHRAGRPVEAEKSYREGLIAVEAVAQRASKTHSAEILEVLGCIQCRLGLVLLSTGRPELGEEALRRGVVAFDRGGNASGPEAKFIRAGAHGSLGGLELANGRLPEAEARYRTAILLLSELVKEFPRAPEYLLHRVQTQYGLGLGYRRAGMLFEAGRVWRESLPLAERLAADFPAAPLHRFVLADVLVDLAGLVRILGEIEEAESLSRRAIPALEERVAGRSGDPGDAQKLAGAFSLLVEAVMGRGDAASAVPLIEKMGLAGDANANLHAAALLVRCMEARMENDRPDPPFRNAQAEDYGRRAVDRLRSAVELGLEKPQDIAGSETFRPLRGMVEFELFVEELKRK